MLKPPPGSTWKKYCVMPLLAHFLMATGIWLESSDPMRRSVMWSKL